jgi:hypothetical protein
MEFQLSGQIAITRAFCRQEHDSQSLAFVASNAYAYWFVLQPVTLTTLSGGSALSAKRHIGGAVALSNSVVSLLTR